MKHSELSTETARLNKNLMFSRYVFNIVHVIDSLRFCIRYVYHWWYKYKYIYNIIFFRVLVSACAGYCCYDTLDKIALNIIKTVSKYSAVQYTSYLRLFCYRFYVCLLLLDSFKYKHIHSHTKTYSKSTNNSPSKTNS